MRYLLLIVCVCLLAGCDGRPRRVPVAGTVFIDGQPLKGGQIRVIPDKARSAQAMIDKEGRFRLGTFEVADGVVLGEHPVEIVSAEQVSGGIRWLIPKKYSSISTSETTIKVERATDDMKIELTWAGGQPFVEAADNSGDAPPVGAVPLEAPSTDSPTPPTP